MPYLIYLPSIVCFICSGALALRCREEMMISFRRHKQIIHLETALRHTESEVETLTAALVEAQSHIDLLNAEVVRALSHRDTAMEIAVLHEETIECQCHDIDGLRDQLAAAELRLAPFLRVRDPVTRRFVRGG